eukprot:TRINITY_DN3477_c0_g2_i1.p1 TRINITY_DN3477_c0_g2~~TRINITY_DN3477_c0_g2_i1.p1  ORF type:complete len:533 (-),score=77.48 TRINITY_DN3477_c0_g2_i1:78-1676(-)
MSANVFANKGGENPILLGVGAKLSIVWAAYRGLFDVSQGLSVLVYVGNSIVASVGNDALDTTLVEDGKWYVVTGAALAAGVPAADEIQKAVEVVLAKRDDLLHRHQRSTSRALFFETLKSSIKATARLTNVDKVPAAHTVFANMPKLAEDALQLTIPPLLQTVVSIANKTIGEKLKSADKSSQESLSRWCKPDAVVFKGKAFSPCGLVAIGDWKGWRAAAGDNTFSWKELGQIFEYGIELMELDVLRMRVVLFISDGHSIRLGEVKRENGRLSYWLAPVQTLENDGVDHLIAALRDNQAMQPPAPQHTFGFALYRGIGSGTTSSVYELHLDKRTAALKHVYGKTSEDVAAMVRHEAECIKCFDNAEHLPSLIQADPDHGLLLMELYSPLSPGLVTRKHLRQLISALRHVHTTLDLVHCDIRISNLLLKNDALVLVDWGHATRAGYPVHVLSLYSCEEALSSGHLAAACDDLHAVVRVLFVLLNSRMQLLVPDTPGQLGPFWKEQLQGPWEAMDKEAAKCNYDFFMEWAVLLA